MNWRKIDGESDPASSLNDLDLVQIYQDFLVEDPDMVMDNAQPEVIVLDSDSPEQAEHDEVSCMNDVLFLFPNLCPDYLAQLALQHNYRSDAIISAILDKQEKGEDYPIHAAQVTLSRKRKRSTGSDEPTGDHGEDDDGEDKDGERDPECARSIRLKMAEEGYAKKIASAEYRALARILISQDFPRVPQNTIRNYLLANNGSVFETHTAMDERLRYWDEDNPPWKEKKISSKISHEFGPEILRSLDMSTYKETEQAALAELVAARELRAVKDARIVAEAEEVGNFLRAQIEGQTTECGICFEECALNRMVQCEGETIHWFCRTCLRSQAESQIGMAKYELTCMSMDGCSAGFSLAQRALFLDKKLTTALDRIEQEAVLRMAGIENLETCPFCPYAAEYPPVEVDKEFRCDNPQCQQVSCRLCRKETHIPKSCAEVAADRGLDARHVLEEAMSEALIRRCNNCKARP
jgi:TRIAD3 protein (E3 ubiquitin-protein ligase RNF216)